jgi:hypothetical protein
MRCGAPSEFVKRKTFSWVPGWTYVLLLAGLLPCVIVQAILTKRKRVCAPLCRAHTGHWAWRTAFVIGGLCAVIVGGIAAAILAESLSPRLRQQGVGGILCAGCAVLALIWLIAAAVIQSGAIRPAEITDDDITLIGVSREFADAYQEGGRRRRRRRYDEEDEDEEYWDRKEVR